MNIPAPKTYLPACRNCSAEDSSPDEHTCAKCDGVIVVCENCHVCIRGCTCGHCTVGAYEADDGS